MTRPRTPQSWLGRNTLVALADIAQEAHSSVLGRVVRALARHGHLNGVTQTQKSARLDHGKDDGAGSARQTFDGRPLDVANGSSCAHVCADNIPRVLF